MLGLMMNVPLQLSRLIDHAADFHGETEVVSRRLDGSLERETWSGMRTRAKRLAKAMHATGVTADTRIASLTWNTLNHIELFYAALGLGCPLHTLNPRLTVDDLSYMIEKVEDTVCFFDSSTLSLAEQIAASSPAISRWIYLDENDPLPETRLKNCSRKSDLVKGEDDDFEWPVIDECSAATICFTSGTTGRPKGVVYTHRSLTLSAMNMSMADMYGNARNGEQVVAMPIAPIFHANGWLMPFSAPMNGHKLVLPGQDFSPGSVFEFMASEGVTIAGAVPTVWGALLAEMQSTGNDLPSLRTALVAGTAIPPPIFDALERKNIDVRQTWGMTEVPGACHASLPPGSVNLDDDEQARLRRDRQGRVTCLADMKIVDDDGEKLPSDGVAVGFLRVRGPLVAARYLGEPPEQCHDWLDTGDIARIHADGSLEIVDRAKDVIKSGGEWISSPQLEAAATNHPAVELAAAIAIPHPHWQERPLLFCKLRSGMSVTPDELREHMSKKVAKWWLPEEVRFINEMPMTPTGKISKKELRQLYGND